jgi:hypothetical protein
MDREVEFVEGNEKEDLPRGFDVNANREAYQFSEANGESRAAKRARGSDIPMRIICAWLLHRLSRALIR